MYAWHVDIFADLANKLKNTKVGSSNLLDHSALVFLSEGGGGTDIESFKPQQPHSVENMLTLVAGKAGGLKGGVHLDGKTRHPSSVLLSAMKGAGSKETKIGQVSGVIPELFK